MTDSIVSPAKPGLDDSLESIDREFVTDPTGRPQSFDLRGSDQADTIIRGWLYLSEAQEGRGGRYTELRLYRTVSGLWIAAVGNRSDNPGEMSFWRTTEVETIGDLMAAWNWSLMAKAIAKEQGWEVRRRLA